MRINLASVFVDDQEKALRFYTEILGFVKKRGCSGNREISLDYSGFKRGTKRCGVGFGTG